MPRQRKSQQNNIPSHEIEALARCLLPDIQAFFESEEGQQEYARWKAQVEKEPQSDKSKSA